jgi:hypothetical protein
MVPFNQSDSISGVAASDSVNGRVPSREVSSSILYRISGVSAADSGDYQARVGNVVDPVGVIFEGRNTRRQCTRIYRLKNRVDVKLAQGGTLKLAIKAAGDGVLKYQWRRNGVIPLLAKPIRNLPAPNSASSTRACLTWRCATISMRRAPSKSAESSRAKSACRSSRRSASSPCPPARSAQLGGRAAFRVLAAGTGPLQYSWSRVGANGLEPLEVSGDTLTLASVKAEDFAKYQVSIVGPLGDPPVTVTDFELKKVDAGPEILTQPAAKSVRVGQPVTLQVAMKPPVAADLAYAWYYTDGMKAGTPIAGGTSNTLALASVASKDTGYYYVVVSDANAATMSIPALVFVNEADPIGLPKTDADIAQRKLQQTLFANEGETVTLRSYAIGDGFRYAWRRLDDTSKPIPSTAKGADGPTLVLRNVSPVDTGNTAPASRLRTAPNWSTSSRGTSW